MRPILWGLAIFLAAFGGAVLIDTFKSSYSFDGGIEYFIGLVGLLTVAAIYVHKLRGVGGSASSKQP
jgi:hypothetical protein